MTAINIHCRITPVIHKIGMRDIAERLSTAKHLHLNLQRQIKGGVSGIGVKNTSVTRGIAVNLMAK